MSSRIAQLHRRNRGEDTDEGFTLIELLIVVVILGILAAIVVFAVQNLGGQSAQSACQSDVRTVESALELYRAQIGDYPGGTVDPGVTVTAAGATGSSTAASGIDSSIDDLMGTAASATANYGPWLKEAPRNPNHYEIGVSTTAPLGVISVLKPDGTPITTNPSHNTSDCSAVT